MLIENFFELTLIKTILINIDRKFSGQH